MNETVTNGALSACIRRARLVNWADHLPAIRRVRIGRGFQFFGPNGKRIRNVETLSRIRKLAIPPAWTNVRICPLSTGHLQATGRDARGRKQYRYHERWTTVRDETKFNRLIHFVKALPKIRARVRSDLKLPGMPRDKVLATVVHLLETTLIRIGNEEYARTNHSFGLTTLRNKHARIRKDEIIFEFRGKSGICHQVTVGDRRIAAIVKRCQEIPGQELFQYLDEAGKRRPVGSSEVNEYLRSAAEGEYTAKDFRTWGATLLAARAFYELPISDSQAELKRNVNRAIAAVARRLGNTVSVCRKCYIHSAIVDSYVDGALLQRLRFPVKPSRQRAANLSGEEIAVLRMLRKCV